MKKDTSQDEVDSLEQHQQHTQNLHYDQASNSNSTRIHFPNYAFQRTSPSKAAASGSHHKTVSHGNSASGGPGGGSSMRGGSHRDAVDTRESSNARRRVVSVDAGNVYGSSLRSGSNWKETLGGSSGLGLGPGKRVPTLSMGPSTAPGLGPSTTSGRRVASDVFRSTVDSSLDSSSKEDHHDSSSLDSGWEGIGAFSDEYDLSHEGMSLHYYVR
ncbi:hypothetical protein EV361DRAFT_46936 [Lentinula raphanica]|nr:hypothetical protein EV361DRAFT_46936 [Lentinula raphanica]